jgi:tetratricopeptide (TPR) repeat protein
MKNWLLIFGFPLWLNGQTVYQEISNLIDIKQFDKAESLAKGYIINHPNDYRIIELLGDTHCHQREWEAASEQYRKLVLIKPKNANFQYKYGGALGMKALSMSKLKALGIIGDVKDAFLKAVEFDPNHIEARWALVELYIKLPGLIGGSTKRALKYAEELENLSLVDGYLAKGYVFEQTNDSKKAEYYYKLAIKEGGSVTCYQKLSDLYERENQPEKAIKNMEASYKHHIRNTSHYQIGRIAVQYNVQLEKGEACLLKYIEDYSARDNVPVEWAYVRLAQISKRRSDKTEALDRINKALSIKPDFKEAIEERNKILAL